MVNVHQAYRDGKDRIDAAIKDAEKGTTGELVIVSAEKAGDFARGESMVGAVLGFVASTLIWLTIGTEASDPTRLAVLTATSFAVFITGYFLGAYIARLMPKLCILLTPKREVTIEVEKSAAHAFRQFHVANTRAATGVLVYVAEAERTVVVMGDSAISAFVIPAEWEVVRDCILDGIKKGQPVDGLVEGIGQIGDLLRRHFPSSTDNDDELPSELHLT